MKYISAILYFLVFSFSISFAQQNTKQEIESIFDEAIVDICGVAAKFMIENANGNPEIVVVDKTLTDLKNSIKAYPSAHDMVVTAKNGNYVYGVDITKDSITVQNLISKINSQLELINKYSDESLNILSEKMTTTLNNAVKKAKGGEIENVIEEEITDTTENEQVILEDTTKHIETDDITETENSQLPHQQEEEKSDTDYFIYLLLFMILVMLSILLIIIILKFKPQKNKAHNEPHKTNTENNFPNNRTKINKPLNSNLQLSIYATDTITDKKKNEDNCVSFSNIKANFNSIIVADGLGSYKNAAQGSHFVVNELKKELLNIDILDSLDIQSLIKNIQNRLIDFAKKEDNIKEPNYHTTIICVIETPIKFIIFYLGNGSIWHVRGNFKSIKKMMHIPWNAINYMNPHSIQEDGQERLQKYISTEINDDRINPTILEITKDDYVGDIIIITTDGIHSEDHRKFGESKNVVWFKAPEKIIKLFDYLYRINNEIVISDNKELQKLISDYLKELQQKRLLDDDTTIGILFTHQALAFLKQS